jgi:hypothetical protein
MKLRKVLASVCAAAVAVGMMIVPTSAQTFDFGFIAFNDVTVTIPDMGMVKPGEIDDLNTAVASAIHMPFQSSSNASAYQDPESTGEDVHDKLVAQNGDFWSKINSITATFKLNGDFAPEDLGDVAAWYQLGETTGWNGNWYIDIGSWAVDPRGPGSEFSVTWDFSTVPFQAGVGGGLLKLGIQISNSGIMPIDVGIEWTSVTIDGDQAAMDEMTAAVSAQRGGGAEAPAAAGDTDAPAAADKGGADTGVADVAVIGGIALVAIGAVVMTRKKARK